MQICTLIGGAEGAIDVDVEVVPEVGEFLCVYADRAIGFDWDCEIVGGDGGVCVCGVCAWNWRCCVLERCCECECWENGDEKEVDDICETHSAIDCDLWCFEGYESET